ncbi:hypothetical protein [Pseudobacter ginsenosidimutans]|uniref:Uncharacterized protein n=1 Tax=Pseudobacter ginsenosidimutans TaxID=661488 RepID=A0A4V2F1V8_9BACT|nr:hypothetical protein [Pseudobacter ginsenosidimutans]QEC43719.1 hypothetical protein FSB84_19280 [Pseudobacter ginsenosidimutans]RZS75126.1 hypothetical protein EV199_0987 [Pseudobacter ginsenosidimutans]
MKQLFILLIITFALSVAGCKKDKDTKPVCLLTVMTPGSGSVVNLYYDDQERLSMMRYENQQFKYEYRADSVIATETNGSAFVQRAIYKLNAQGLPVLMRLEVNTSGTQWFQYAYEYNGTEVVKSVNTNYANSTTETYLYTWSNGNLVKAVEGPNERKFEYYTDKPRLQGDGFLIEMLSLSGSIGMYSLNGAVEIVRNKNLLKKMEHTLLSVGSYSITYEYDSDKEGRIKKTSILNSNTNSRGQLDYQYRCN